MSASLGCGWYPDPDIYPGINAKYTLENVEKPISIFIFRNKNIVITGAKKFEHIVQHVVYKCLVVAQTHIGVYG